MKKSVVRFAAVLFALLFMAGCAAQGPVKSPAPFQPVKIDADRYEAKVDSFLVIFDGSSSMDERSGGMKKFATATEFVKRMNRTLPELGQIAGFRSLGHDKSVSVRHTELFGKMTGYSTAAMNDALGKVHTPGGTSPLQEALASARSDFEFVQGQKAVIIVSDGEEPYMMQADAVEQAKNLKAAYGSELCIYPIHVGDSEAGKQMMGKLADIGECGFSADAAALMSGKKMADFVKTVFLKEKPEPEPKPVVKEEKKEVVKKPERKDTDRDGVYDDEDECPNTPLGADVNFKGCWTVAGVLFDTNKATLKPESHETIGNIYRILGKNPGLSIILKGHTDSRGAAAYNMDLSLRRARSVQSYLVEKGISPDRIDVKGLGEADPVADNDTKSGRAKNRRVEIEPVY
ncbi:MAG: OmpA family protein [Desulfarculaceae bacterium]|nr:OmpA family protein [Desulfarculaceae bacterium]